jgi:hypothetical protein
MLAPRRPLLRAGVLAGGMYAANRAGKASVERQYEEASQDQRIGDLETQQPPPPAAPPTDLVGQLTKLQGMVQQGLLTQDEFQTAKTKLLAG